MNKYELQKIVKYSSLFKAKTLPFDKVIWLILIVNVYLGNVVLK